MFVGTRLLDSRSAYEGVHQDSNFSAVHMLLLRVCTEDHAACKVLAATLDRDGS